MKVVLNGIAPARTDPYEPSCILNMENGALWLHRAADNKPPFLNLFPRRLKKLIGVKNLFERLYLFYLRYLCIVRVYTPPTMEAILGTI